MNVKGLFGFFLAWLPGLAFAECETPYQSADVRFRRLDGRVETQRMDANRQPDGAWRFRIPSWTIGRDVDTIELVADCAVSGKASEGWWYLGDGRYGHLTRAAGDELVSKHDRIALFGLSRPDRTWCAIVKGLRLEYSSVLQVTNGIYRIFPRFKIREIEFDPYEDAVVDYYPLTGDDATYSGMGRLYRRYQLGRGEVRPLAERVRESEALAYSSESIFLRCKFGRCDRRLTGEREWLRQMPPVVVDYTFADFRKIMADCKSLGIDKCDMCLVGFQPQGHDGPFPDLFPADARFGGQEEMEKTVAYGKSLGYRMSIHMNQHNFYRNARRWNEDDVGKGPDGLPRKYAILPGGQSYNSCFEVICNRYFDRDIEDLKALGLNGLLHVDVMSTRLPTPCHDPRHPATRRDEVRWLQTIGRKARAAFGGYSSEAGMDHGITTLDNLLYVTSYPGWFCPKTPLVDGYLPVWEVVYHGIVLYTPFYATLDAGTPRVANGVSDATGKNAKVFEFLGSPRRTLLKLFEYGGRPMFYYTDYRHDLPSVKQVYDAYQELKHLQFVFIREHARLAEDVFVTRYENGEEVVVNYSNKPFGYRSVTVPAQGYRLCR